MTTTTLIINRFRADGVLAEWLEQRGPGAFFPHVTDERTCIDREKSCCPSGQGEAVAGPGHFHGARGEESEFSVGKVSWAGTFAAPRQMDESICGLCKSQIARWLSAPSSSAWQARGARLGTGD